MSIRICHHKTQGLFNDFLILKSVLQNNFLIIHAQYEEIQLVKNEALTKDTEICNVNIFIEHIYPDYINYANKNVFLPNNEWLNKKDHALCGKMNAIFCKTKFSMQKLQSVFSTMSIHYTGFASINREDSKISKDFNYCLHIKGVSKYKNTQLLIDTWMKNPQWPTLVVVHYGTLNLHKPFKLKENIIIYQHKLDEIELQTLMNKCGIHICCSFSEGFGHYINEARSAGAYIVTTNGEPMKSFVKNDCGSLVHVDKLLNVNFGIGYVISEESLTSTLNNVFSKSFEYLKTKGEENKIHYHQDFNEFKRLLLSQIKSLVNVNE